MTKMCHDILANAMRLVVSACRCKLATEPRYRALAGKKRRDKCQSRGGIMMVLQRLEVVEVHAVVAHASAKSYATQAAKEAGWTTARAERAMRARFYKDVPDHAAFRFVPFVAEACGYMGTDKSLNMNQRVGTAAESGRIPNGACESQAVQVLPVMVQRPGANAEIYHRSELVISREKGLHYDAGFAVPVLML